MLFRRFYDENLAQTSYMIACEKTHEAIVVDPNSDVAQYTRAAGADRVRIAHVTETHIHADFVSGAHALAKAAGAVLHFSGEGGSEWGYTAHALEGANVLRDGSRIDVGRIRVRAAHTPGHTPEHLTFFVSDLARGLDPVGALTGDFVFVGDVGRPDLLERAAGAKGSTESSARKLFRSLQEFGIEPDHLQIWPGHGAGSPCGKSLGSMPQSTLGYEKLFNWAFAKMSEEEFVAKVLEDQPVPPRYFAEMKRVNRLGAERPTTPEPTWLGLPELDSAIGSHATVIDTRPAHKFAAGHVPGTLNIPLGKSFLNWSGALVPETPDFYIITETASDDAMKNILGDLSKIGLTRVAGVFRSDVLREWKVRHGVLERVPQLDSTTLKEIAGRDGLQVVDVRSPEEVSGGHLPGAIHIPLAQLPDRIGEIDTSAPVVLHCRGGGRSSIATSFLQSHGVSDVSNLAGGFDAWVAHGFEVESAKPAKSVTGRKTVKSARGRKAAKSAGGRQSATAAGRRKPTISASGRRKK
ncbi:MAG TPA: rhodanese-like domain-containing protein [Gemmatimonadaceae bacterium]|nr:rhodanese-like domain-containing protein [Gemmatimonadaceae bacterium]